MTTLARGGTLISRALLLLLPRARDLFAGFLLLAAAVQLLELIDAETAWFPDRTVALVGICTMAAWALLVHRTRRAPLAGDVALVVALTVTGLGRNGAVLLSLLAIAPLRALHGGRARVAGLTAGLFVGFGTVTVVHHGSARLVDGFGFLIVLAAVTAFTVTLRRLGEVLAEHDLHARLDGVAAGAAAELVAATAIADVDRIGAEALARVRERCAEAADDPSPARSSVEVVPEQLDAETGADADRGPGRGARVSEPVASVLARLSNDTRLARQRVGSEVRYRTVAEHSRDGVYLRDLAPHPGYRYLNPAAEDILGVRTEQLAADPSLARQLVHPEDLPRLHAAIVVGGLLDDPVEGRLCRPDGEVRWIALQERLVGVEAGARTVIGTLRDVTRQQETEAALQRVIARERAAADELRHLDAMKSIFLQAVSHELRTPLSAVIGAAQTLDVRDGAMDADQRRRMVDIVQRQSARLETLLTDLLDVDRLSRGIIVPERRDVDLLALVAGVVDGLEGRDRVTVTGEPVVLAVDPAQIERIVDNLLRNAVRHTPADGRIVCRIAADDVGASIVIDDEGPGVPDELKDELFAPFAQGPTAGAAASPGTGIGLALVRALAELHGGSTWIDDRPGGGARFVVCLPRVHDQVAVLTAGEGERVAATHHRLP
ncbi:MAG: PAS domain-containing sensor histidine kinase [Nitriliruptor sp.]|uniref:sensor histidine kinase n=1 Tax=Nitriliruptor sp. TaxID=2448056 RepID=UPI0034A00269